MSLCLSGTHIPSLNNPFGPDQNIKILCFFFKKISRNTPASWDNCTAALLVCLLHKVARVAYNQINQYIVMSRSKNKRGKSHQLPIFINKLLEMVQDHTIEPVFGWTSTGDSFNIKSVTKFTEEVLPKYFKHKNFSSFIRQLNMYGFRKIRHEEGENVYMNEHFKMGGRHQLRNISRRIREEKEESVVLYNGRGSQRNEGGKELSELKSKQKNLEQLCKHMVKQNQKLMEENQNLVRRLENGYRERQKKMESFLLALLNQNSSNQITNGTTQPLQICYGDFGKDDSSTATEKKTLVESMSHNLKRSEHYLKVRSIIDSIYGRMSQQKREVISEPMSPYSLGGVQPEVGIKLQRDDDGFLSINSFMDIEEFEENINLQQSR